MVSKLIGYLRLLSNERCEYIYNLGSNCQISYRVVDWCFSQQHTLEVAGSCTASATFFKIQK